MAWFRNQGPGLRSIEDIEARREWRRQKMNRRPYSEKKKWYQEWKRTGVPPDFTRRPMQPAEGSESRHLPGHMNRIMDGSDGEEWMRGRVGDKRKKNRITNPNCRKEVLVFDAERMGAMSLATAFCFSCWNRVRLTDGERGPYSECSNCGEPTGVEHLIHLAECSAIEEKFQCAKQSS